VTNIADPTENVRQKGRKAYFKGNMNINFAKAKLEKNIVKLIYYNTSRHLPFSIQFKMAFAHKLMERKAHLLKTTANFQSDLQIMWRGSKENFFL